VHFNLILSDEFGEQLSRVAADRRFPSPEAFIRAAIQNEIARRPAEEALEQQLSETLYQLSEQAKRLAEEGTAPRVIDSLNKLIFACTAELESHAFAKAVSIKSKHRR
jgi:hypothetical protein